VIDATLGAADVPPNAPIETGYAHAVACIMADEAYVRGVPMVWDPAMSYPFPSSKRASA
jgi:hypothetical protein